jgi:extracellular factor (EF) 3-hydroxypalmitic acid methyl ester biosynthesis protein
MDASTSTNTTVICKNSRGIELHATMLRLSRRQVVLEIYDSQIVLQMSEVLDLKISAGQQQIYLGRAVIHSMVNTGTTMICEATLEEAGLDLAYFASLDSANGSRGFGDFLRQWQKMYKVRSEFKVVIADMQTFLMDLRLWLDQVEVQLQSTPSQERVDLERKILLDVGQQVVPSFDSLHERLENLSGTIEADLRPVHQDFSKRQLHSLVLCSPFAYRTYQKPLGYAGDYEMVNMIIRDPFEGNSLFAKMMNYWFLSQWPSKAHRNRITYLTERLVHETARGMRKGKPTRIFNLGCGPAQEIQRFLENAVSNHAQFTLCDFNDETIQHTTSVLDETKRRFGRKTAIQINKKAVQNILRDSIKLRGAAPEQKYEMVYCAGLFDYLPDYVCKQLMEIFYSWLTPGGLLVATNVDDCKPFRHMLEFVLDWHLIYRGQKHGATLIPEGADMELCSVKKDVSEVNVFIEVRKPENA